jgi:hypothetical protein
MKPINKTVFVICGKDREQEIETEHEAIEIKTFLEDFFNMEFTIKQRDKTLYEIEKGDKIYWLKDGEPNTDRIDIVTDIVKNAWGDKQYLTKELNGNRIGSAYESHICLVM